MQTQFYAAAKMLKLFSANINGFKADPITVETDLYSGLHSFKIVGLPDQAVEEARERISSAVRKSGAKPPQHHSKKVTVNLAPADIKKRGTWFDLPIALSFLEASEQLAPKIKTPALAVGELGLSGELRSVRGILAAALLARKLNALLIIPKQNLAEANIMPGIEIMPAENLSSVIENLENNYGIVKSSGAPEDQLNLSSDFDFGFIYGQENAKRGLEIAAAGRHHILMTGPPGSGKTLLARTLPTILPELSTQEMIEATTIWSVAGLLSSQSPLVQMPPFRAPHHSSSRAALIGGGSGKALPGETTLAHRGVLFLDEFPEFQRHVLEALRQPLEDGFVTVGRSEGSSTYPANFMLAAAQNPCPCGNSGDPKRECICSAGEIMRYHKRVSGPILDRIDLNINVPRLPFEKLRGDYQAEQSEQIRQRVKKARQVQTERFKNMPFLTNSSMRPKDVKTFCKLDADGEELLKTAHERFNLSPRAITRILKVARTITDLSESERIKPEYLAEAIQYRKPQD